MGTPLFFRSATQQGKLLRKGKLSPHDLLDLALTRVAFANPRVNALIVSDVKRARLAADAAHRRLKKGEANSPFDGVPMTIKESFNWKGLPTTWGAPAWRDNIAQDDAAALTLMLDAGAVAYGKTNVPFLLADWQSFNEIYGTTNNPWDLARVPGGSSGGSAAALATGMCALEVGSDIGASIRNPAHYCGLYGHKPTFGLVPMRGHTLGGVGLTDLSCAGPLARSAEDLKHMLKILAQTDGTMARAAQFRLRKSHPKKLKDFRVAVMLSAPESEVDQPLTDLILECTRFLEPRVGKISYTARPAFTTQEAFEIYITLLRSATSRRQTDAEFRANQDRVAAMDPDDKSFMAVMIRAYVMSHRDWLNVNERRFQMQALWEAFFDDWDVMICPAAASAAFLHDHTGDRHDRTILVNGHQVPTFDQLFWAGYSCGFGLPSTIAPIGLTKQGLPGGVQIIARAFDDMTAIHFAHLLEQDYAAFVPPPDFIA